MGILFPGLLMGIGQQGSSERKALVVSFTSGSVLIRTRRDILPASSLNLVIRSSNSRGAVSSIWATGDTKPHQSKNLQLCQLIPVRAMMIQLGAQANPTATRRTAAMWRME